MAKLYHFDIYTKAHPTGFPTFSLTKTALKFVKHEAFGLVLRFAYHSSNPRDRGREVEVILPAQAIDRIERWDHSN